MGHPMAPKEEEETKPLPITEKEHDWIGQLHNNYLNTRGYDQLTKSGKSLLKKLKKW